MFVSGKDSKDSDILRRMILKTNFSEHWYELSSHQSLEEAFPEYELFYDLIELNVRHVCVIFIVYSTLCKYS